ncbi:uncharacterized protein SPPG_03463 [Spizellomyces punctatus DAOM BR117]|uniref:Heme haloperoxidase family profile domain-containing protein n=1 Tax=Spizellomyces punctatus (strain DAOM BR117) TaxID=645134 RepID=A0A0L0HKP5_SPIPD|nr:uncharacterized protein SPPG_03463 [Spizellomyces punctatus DAOM BR117]KND01667.1 hypothetical protein SPPG_03463 [Spizellomyces punctatus DAOM BR117]|eukprot:XP_016609706.1 hypothetical protein SPPG_03463 [Spizellomyces punctatus DAOM BR117]
MLALKSFALYLIASAASVTALPAALHPFLKPPGASRGPCPGLNILANHGFLPRDGKGLTLPILQQALSDAYNFSPDFTATVFAIQSNPVTGIAVPFALEDLKKHVPFVVEHDASISRNDFATSRSGDNYSYNRTLFANSLQYVRDLGFTELNSTAMAHIRHLRETQSEMYNPQFSYGRLSVNPDGSLVVDPSMPEFFALGEAAFILDLFGSNNGLADSDTSMAQIAWMFTTESFPSGYKPPAVQATLTTALARAAEIKGQLASLPPIPKDVAAKYWNTDFSKKLALQLGGSLLDMS